jgi:hypothetical protein
LNNRRAGLLLASGILLAILAIVGLTWANYRYVSQSTGNNKFFPRWAGTRLLLTKGWSPYSQETTAEIQKAIYGREAQDGEDPAYFMAPLYAFLVYLPFALTPNIDLMRAVWMTLLEISLLLIAGFSLNLSRWQVARILWLVIMIFSLLWYYGFVSVIQGDAAILVALLICLSFFTLQAEQDALAGFLMALATIKPTIVLVLVVFVLIWAVAQRRWQLFWGFFGSLALIVAATSLLIPTWLVENIRQIVLLYRFETVNSVGTLIGYWLPGVGRQFGLAITVVVITILIWEFWQALGKDLRWFFWTASLALALTPLIGIPTSITHYVALLPGFILVLATWDQRWGVLGRLMMFISLLFFSAGIWGWVYYGQQQGIPPELNAGVFFALPIFMLIGLYWVRWWAIRPPRLPLQEEFSA